MPHPLPTTIGRPATRALRVAGIETLEQLTEHTEKEILSLHGVGPKAIRLLKVELESLDLSFRASSL